MRAVTAPAGLQPSVVDGLPGVFAVWEGRGLTYLYTDSKGFVTIGTGNLVDPVSMATGLPFYNPSGSVTSQQDIAFAWREVKDAWPGVQSTRCAALTSIRLRADGLTALIMRTIAQDWAGLLAQFPGCDQWPADAQLGVLSSSWAWGSYFCNVWNKIGGTPMGFGDQFKMQVATPDFALAAGVMLDVSVHEERINPGIVPRDRAEVVMFQNAQAVIEAGADRSKLWYPAAFQA